MSEDRVHRRPGRQGIKSRVMSEANLAKQRSGISAEIPRAGRSCVSRIVPSHLTFVLVHLKHGLWLWTCHTIPT